MADNILATCQLVGFVFILACFFTGAFVILRWGGCGVGLIWQRRRELDIEVRADAESRWRGGGR